MIGLAVIGLLIMASAVAFGVWYIFNNTSFKKTTNRYRYVKTKDENGNEITKVIDLDEEKE
jgi:hypothetical protein